MIFGRRSAPPPPQQLAQQAPPRTSIDEARDLSRTLTEIVRRANRNGNRMPEGGIPALHEVEDEIRPLLTYLSKHRVNELEMIPVRALVTDYLPTTVERFLALPGDFALRHRGRAGLTPAQDFLAQLNILSRAAKECAEAIYVGDAHELAAQGTFLQTKFTRSDLDLD